MKKAWEKGKGDRGKPANKSHFIAGFRHFLGVGARAITKQPVTKTEYPPTAGQSHGPRPLLVLLVRGVYTRAEN